jgi:hypothetical protein
MAFLKAFPAQLQPKQPVSKESSFLAPAQAESAAITLTLPTPNF